MTLILYYLSGNSCTSISLVLVSVDLFCSFVWNMFLCFFVFLITFCWDMHIWKISPLSQFVQTGLYRERHTPISPATFCCGLWKPFWKDETSLGLYIKFLNREPSQFLFLELIISAPYFSVYYLPIIWSYHRPLSSLTFSAATRFLEYVESHLHSIHSGSSLRIQNIACIFHFSPSPQGRGC